MVCIDSGKDAEGVHIAADYTPGFLVHLSSVVERLSHKHRSNGQHKSTLANELAEESIRSFELLRDTFNVEFTQPNVFFEGLQQGLEDIIDKYAQKVQESLANARLGFDPNRKGSLKNKTQTYHTHIYSQDVALDGHLR